MIKIINASGKYWTGTCWGDIGEEYTSEQLSVLNIDNDVNPDNYFANDENDVGWGDELGEIFARAVRS